LRATYDKAADAAYVYFVDDSKRRAVSRTVVCDLETEGSAINLDLDSEGILLGIEIMGASRVLPSEVIADASGSSR